MESVGAFREVMNSVGALLWPQGDRLLQLQETAATGTRISALQILSGSN